MSLPHPDTDPRLAIRADLVAAGRRQLTRRRRRRGATLAAVAVTGLLGTAAATAKIEGSGTGVPVLDRVLEISAERRPPMPVEYRDGKVIGPPPIDDRVGPGGASPPLELPWGVDGSEGTGIGVAYLNRSDHLCFVVVGPHRRPERGGLGCTAAHIVDDWLEAEPAAVTTAGGADRDLSAINGFARGDVVAVRYEGPDGPVEAALGAPWRPGGADAKLLRPFVVLFRQDFEAQTPRETLRAITDGDLTATLADGRVVKILRGR